MRWLMVPLLVGATVGAQSCATPSPAGRRFELAQTGRADWEAVIEHATDDHPSSVRVTCNDSRPEISVVWIAESGDWVVYDTYGATGAYFTRIVRFAQFDGTLSLTRERPDASPVVRIKSEEAREYQFLLTQFAVWSSRRDVPFDVPACAASIFPQ